MANQEDDRLSQIATQWTLVVRAHHDEGDERHQVFAQLLPRYCRAVKSYLSRLVGNDAAEELSQEFALRFLRGEFRQADPNRGRFRDYIKSSVIYLAKAHRNKRAAKAIFGPIPDELRVRFKSSDDHGFHDLWRDELLNRVWSELEKTSQQKDDLRFAVLQARAKNPEASSDQLAEQLSASLSLTMTSDNLRQVIHRARTKFAELLRAEVAATLPGCDDAQVDEELADLGLLKYLQ